MLQLPSGTVTFLFTDIEGSTKLWENHPEEMRSALALHDEIVRASIEANGGYVFKTMGDAFCAAFATAPEAIAAALDAQQSLFSEPWEIEPPVRSRMALHTGTAQEREGDYFGQPLNRAARLLSAGHGGQTLVSAATQELVRDTLLSSCSLTDLGDAFLTDLTRPERVYQLNHPSLPSEFPPLRSLNSGELPNNLPQQPTSFIGREKEIADVKALLLKCRLLTLVGAGGAGKTRLALQAAADLLDGDGDGVWLVELAPVSDPGLVPSLVSQVLRIKEAAGESIQTTLVNALKAKNLLIVLDNCEHVLDACCSLATGILRSCPGAHILATSREPLGASGEQVYRIPSLSVPKQSAAQPQAYTAVSLSTFESVRLFIERAKAVQPSFAVTDANAPSVAQLCYQLDGIPLAIELAAARIRALPVEQVNNRLDQRFRLLTGGSRALLPRQQTLKALIDWSYDLLSDQERLLLARLSIFAGGCTLDSAEIVCSGEGDVEKWEMLDLLTSLTDKSLVVYEEGEATARQEARYRLLESIRQYAGERLSESGEDQALIMRRRHRDWCVALAEEADPHLSGAAQAVWLSRLEAEHDNLRAALLRCEQAQEKESRRAMLRLSGALLSFWDMRGHFSEGRVWLNKTLDCTHALLSGQQDSPGEDTREVLSQRAKLLNGAGILADAQGDYSAAHALYQECLEIRRRLGDRKNVARSLNNLGEVARAQGDYVAAGALYRECLEILREFGEQRGIAISLNNLGTVAYAQGDYPAAHALYQECLEISRQLGDEQGVAYSLGNLGALTEAQGNHSAARVLHQECLDILRRLGDQQGVAYSLGNLGNVACVQGDYTAARALYQEYLGISRQLGDQQGVASSLEGIAKLALSQNDAERSVRVLSAAAALRDRIGSQLNQKQQQESSSDLDAARSTLGDAAFEIAWEEGHALTGEQAAEYALGESN